MPSLADQGTDFISIAVADSTRIHTQLLADAMGSDSGIQVVASTSSSRELLAAVERAPIDVAVVSFGLDDRAGRGPELLREMRSLRPQIKGVILLESSRPQDVLDSFRAGAKGIFSKHEKVESLCRCIRCVHEGQIWASSAELDHVLGALANSPLMRAANHNGLDMLSARERHVVQHLAAGMTNREIAKALKLSPHTVKNYLFRIFDKLGVSSRTELLYLTMNNPQPAAFADGNAGITTAVDAAESGSASAQLVLAEHFTQATESNGHQQDAISAYMWYLLAERTAAPLLERIENGKKNLMRSLSLEQIAEGESRADEWLKNSKKKPTFAESADGETKAMVARP